MIKLLVVALAYALIWLIGDIEQPYYSVASAGVYALVCIVAGWAAIKINSKLLYLYAMVNLLAAVINLLMVNADFYFYARDFYWHSRFNFSLLIEVVEVMLLLNGIYHVIIIVLSGIWSNDNSYKDGYNRMVHIKREGRR